MDVLLYDGDQPYVVTQRVGNVSRSDNLDSLAMDVSFDYLFNRNDRYTMDMVTEPGDHFRYVEGDEVLVEGLIADTDDDMEGTVSVTGYDYGYWLNKKIDVQFNGCSTSQAIETMCKDYGISVSCVEIATTVERNYFETSIGEIMKELIGMVTFQTGQKYRMEVRGETVYVEKYEDLLVEPVYIAAGNLAPYDVTRNPGGMTVSRSIEDMYNVVKVMKDGEVIDEARDEDSITRFGEKEFKIEDDENAKADVTLKELNRVVRTISCELLGDDRVRSGRIIQFAHDELPGKYLVKNCTHNYSSNAHTMSVDLVDAETTDASVAPVDPSEGQEETVEDTEETGTEETAGGNYTAGDGIATGQYTWPIPGVYCNTTTYYGHTNNARDFPVPYGSQVVAADGGTVNWVQYWDGYTRWGNQSYGNCVRITHGGGRYTLYAHLSRIDVRSGQTVSKGQAIGAVGSTGNSTGPHLHMEIVHNGWGIDPKTIYGR